MDQYVRPYPAAYRAPLINRLKPALIVAPIYLLAIFGRVHLTSTSPAALWLIAILGFFLVVTVALSTSFCTVTLYADRIEKRTWFGTKIMRKGEVGAIRSRGRGLVMLAYKYNYGDGMVMPKGIGGDATWDAWMTGADPHSDSNAERSKTAR